MISNEEQITQTTKENFAKIADEYFRFQSGRQFAVLYLASKKDLENEFKSVPESIYLLDRSNRWPAGDQYYHQAPWNPSFLPSYLVARPSKKPKIHAEERIMRRVKDLVTQCQTEEINNKPAAIFMYTRMPPCSKICTPLILKGLEFFYIKKQVPVIIVYKTGSLAKGETESAGIIEHNNNNN